MLGELILASLIQSAEITNSFDGNFINTHMTCEGIDGSAYLVGMITTLQIEKGNIILKRKTSLCSETFMKTKFIPITHKYFSAQHNEVKCSYQGCKSVVQVLDVKKQTEENVDYYCDENRKNSAGYELKLKNNNELIVKFENLPDCLFYFKRQ